jgi:hypothetical protein
MPKCHRKVSPASAFIPVVSCLSPASAFRHQRSVRYWWSWINPALPNAQLCFISVLYLLQQVRMRGQLTRGLWNFPAPCFLHIMRKKVGLCICVASITWKKGINVACDRVRITFTHPLSQTEKVHASDQWDGYNQAEKYSSQWEQEKDITRLSKRCLKKFGTLINPQVQLCNVQCSFFIFVCR